MALAFDTELGTASGAAVSSLAVSANASRSNTGRVFVYICRLPLAVTLSSVADDEGDTWTVIANVNDGSINNIGVAIKSGSFGLASADNVTGTFSGLAAGCLAEVCCFTGFTNSLNAAALDQVSTGAAGTSTSPASNNVTTTHAAEVALGIICGTGTTPASFTAGGSFTKTAATPFGSGTTDWMCIEWQILAATQTINATGTLPTSKTWEAIIITLYDSAAAGGTVTPQRSLRGVGT